MALHGWAQREQEQGTAESARSRCGPLTVLDAYVVKLPSDDPPSFSDEPHTCLYVRGHWDYGIAVGPNDDSLPLHWITMRTSGGHDDFACCLFAALFHHLRGDANAAKACATSASECSKHQIDRATELRQRRLDEGQRTCNVDDQYMRENAGAMTRETWDAIGRERGWTRDPVAAGQGIPLDDAMLTMTRRMRESGHRTAWVHSDNGVLIVLRRRFACARSWSARVNFARRP